MSTNIKRGKVYIFNNVFKDRVEGKRDGSQKDVEEIQRTFRLMNADVEDPFIDLSEKDIKNKMEQIKKTNFTEYDYVAIVIGSHGYEDGTASTVDRRNIYLQRTFLIPLFKNETLSKKLKWMITQTCRGDLDLVTESSKTEAEGVELPFHDTRYFLISYATSEGFVSRRGAISGSFFIQNLCKELLKHYRNEDILSILNKVHDAVLKQSISLVKVEQKTSNQENFNKRFSFRFVKDDPKE